MLIKLHVHVVWLFSKDALCVYLHKVFKSWRETIMLLSGLVRLETAEHATVATLLLPRHCVV